MLFYEGIYFTCFIREHKSSGYSFHFFRVVAIRVSCIDIARAKEKSEYQRTAEISLHWKVSPSLKYFIRTRLEHLAD